MRRRPWLPAGYLSSQQVARALGLTQDQVRKQRTALGGLKQANGRLAYPVEQVRAELLRRGMRPPAWLPRSAAQQRRRERMQALALIAAASVTAVGLGYALVLTGDDALPPIPQVGAGPLTSHQQPVPYGDAAPPAGRSGASDDRRRAPQVRSATPTAVCRDGTVSYSATRRGTCSHHGGVARWGPPPSARPPDPQADAAPVTSSLEPPAVGVAEYNGECEPVQPDVLERLTLLQPHGVDVRLVSGWSLRGERGTVLGGYLSGTQNGSPVDGAFASWYLRSADGSLHRYTHHALTLSAWPQLGNGKPTRLSVRVMACAAANAG